MGWDFKNDQAIYPQLISIIKRRIITGMYLPGAKLPSVRELAEESGVNPNTMQRALMALEQEGLVYTQRTSGRFVTENTGMLDDVRMQEAKELVETFYVKMQRLGYDKQAILQLIETEGEQQ